MHVTTKGAWGNSVPLFHIDSKLPTAPQEITAQAAKKKMAPTIAALKFVGVFSLGLLTVRPPIRTLLSA